MALEHFVLRLEFAAALVLLLIGAIVALSSANAVKRLGGAVITLIAALLGLAVLEAPAAALSVGVAVMFATLAIGVALGVRLQEAYGAVESPDINQADAQSEAAEPDA